MCCACWIAGNGRFRCMHFRYRMVCFTGKMSMKAFPMIYFIAWRRWRLYVGMVCTAENLFYIALGSLVGIRLQDDFWLFANHESNRSNACHIGEFYLREISDRFRKAAFVADFKEKSYSWAQETIGGLYCIAPPKGYHPHTINYLFTIHVACTDFYLLEGYSRASNQPTFFKLEI